MNSNVMRAMLLAILLTAAGGLAGCAESDGDIPELSGGGGGDGGGDLASCTIDGTGLCAIPGAGEAIVGGAGGSCPDDAGQLSATQLCQVPGVGAPLVEANCGTPCPPPEEGSEPPLTLEQLCAIPELGPAIVEGSGGTCPDGGGGGDGQCVPNQCDPGGNGCLSDIPGFEALVCP